MARNRMIKPEFWEDDRIAECSTNARLLFIALWNFADDEGYLEFRSKWLKAKCFPYDNLKIEPLVNELLKVGRLEQRGEIIWIKNFTKHQKIDRPKTSELSHLFNNSTNDQRAIDEQSTTKREEKGKEEKRKEDEKSPLYQEIYELCLKFGLKFNPVPATFSVCEERYEAADIKRQAEKACVWITELPEKDARKSDELRITRLSNFLQDCPEKKPKTKKQTDDEQVEEYLKLTQNQNATNTQSV